MGLGTPPSPSPPLRGREVVSLSVREPRGTAAGFGVVGVAVLSCASEFPGKTHTFVNGRWGRGEVVCV